MLDIHTFDGKYTIFLPSKFDNHTKSQLFDFIKSKINESDISSDMKNYGTQGISIIQRDISTPSNYDNFNNVYADDILAELVIQYMSEKDSEILRSILSEICDQMWTMISTNGTCPMGRVTRLAQLYKSFVFRT